MPTALEDAAAVLVDPVTKVKSFAGLTGSASVTWDPYDFTNSNIFPSTSLFSVLRCTIDIDLLALSANDLGATYPINYAAKIVYGWKKATFTGFIVNSDVPLNNTGSSITWSISTAGGAGAMRITATGQATINTFNVVMAARLSCFVYA